MDPSAYWGAFSGVLTGLLTIFLLVTFAFWLYTRNRLKRLQRMAKKAQSQLVEDFRQKSERPRPEPMVPEDGPYAVMPLLGAEEVLIRFDPGNIWLTVLGNAVALSLWMIAMALVYVVWKRIQPHVIKEGKVYQCGECNGTGYLKRGVGCTACHLRGYVVTQRKDPPQ